MGKGYESGATTHVRSVRGLADGAVLWDEATMWHMPTDEEKAEAAARVEEAKQAGVVFVSVPRRGSLIRSLTAGPSKEG